MITLQTKTIDDSLTVSFCKISKGMFMLQKSFISTFSIVKTAESEEGN